MARYETERIQQKYHDALVGWQKKNFPELEFLEKNWANYFAKQTPFELIAKIGKLKDESIEYGRFQGKEKIEHAGEMTGNMFYSARDIIRAEMTGNMFYSARDIIRAQASTELGSIQQHRLTLEKAPNDQMKVSILRIMAEELRHAYQMFWVLSHDPSWKKPGHPDVAADTMDELLSMELGNHVLDAFNIPFNNFLDNVTFATVIDLVGKYQLEMQKVFSYAPMARSMGPMLSEEGFHIGSGRSFLKEIAVMATEGKGDHSIEDIQRHLNLWIPRGVEMFGNERGGETAMAFGFKDRNNGTAQGEYYNEVRELLELINVAIVQVLVPDISAPDARTLVREVQDTGEVHQGVHPEHLLFAPDVKFFRQRGMEEIIFLPYDVYGEMLTEGGAPVTGEGYLTYLHKHLPEYFPATTEFDKYQKMLLGREEPDRGSYGW